MVWYILTAILFVVALICILGAALLPEFRPKGFLYAGGAFVLWAVMSVFFTWHSVEAGHVGLVRQFGAYTGSVKEAGAVFTAPWQQVEEVRVRNASHELRMDGQGGNGSAASKESQEVFVVATINYSLEKGCVEDLYTNYGASYYDTIIEPRAKQIFKAESVRFSAVDILPNREKIRKETQAELTRQLEAFCVRGLDFLLTNVGFGPAFTAAIEEKQVATQQAAAEENRVQIAKQQAQQKIEEARGAAAATRLQAKADAYAARQRRRFITPQLVEWERIQRWQPEIIYLPADTIVGLPNTAGGSR